MMPGTKSPPSEPQSGAKKPTFGQYVQGFIGGYLPMQMDMVFEQADRERRRREQEMDALAAFGQSVRGMMGGSAGGAGAPAPASPEMAMLSGGMQDAPGPKTYSAPIGPGMDGEPLPGVREPEPRPMPQQAQRQPASLPAGPPRLPTYRDFAPVLAEAVMSGNPTVAARANALGSVFDKAAPSIKYERGMRYDERDPSSAPGYIHDLAEGQLPAYDADGRLLGVMNANGYVQSIAEVEAAKTRASEGAKAGFDLIEVPQADGSMRMMPRDQAVQAVGGGSGGLPALPGSTGPRAPASPAGGAPGGFGVRQSPAQQRLETDRAAAQASVEAMTPKALGTYNALDRKTDFILETLKKARGQVSGGLGGSAGMNETMAGVPGTNARNLAATLDTLLANLGFNELAEMRANSPTGGAVGSLTERELNLLGSVMGSLDQGQDPTQLVGNIDRMILELEKAAKERRTAFQSQYGGASASTAKPPPPSKAQLRAGQVYQTPRGPMLWNGKAFVQQ